MKPRMILVKVVATRKEAEAIVDRLVGGDVGATVRERDILDGPTCIGQKFDVFAILFQ